MDVERPDALLGERVHQREVDASMPVAVRDDIGVQLPFAGRHVVVSAAPAGSVSNASEAANTV